MRRALLRLAAAACAVMLGTGFRAASLDAAEDDRLAEGAHQRLIERVDRSQTSEYRSALAELDAQVAAHPEDSIIAVERCRFVAHFAYSDDQPIESAADNAEACIAMLRTPGHASAPAVKLYLFEREWGEDRGAKGEALLADPKTRWTELQRATLHEHLSNVHASKDLLKAGPHALAAVKLNPASGARLIAAEYLLRIGAKTAAARMIEDMPGDQWQPWTLASAVKLFLAMDQNEGARQLVAKHAESVDDGTRVALARALLRSGRAELGRSLLTMRKPQGNDQHVPTDVLREEFELECDYGSADTAVAAYRKLREQGLTADPFGRYRLALLASHPAARWSWTDLSGVAVLIGTLLALASLPVLLISPVHYRSAVKALRGQPPAAPSPSAPWSLRQLWYAIAVLLLGSLAGFYVLDYPTFHTILAGVAGFADHYTSLSRDTDVGRALLVSSVVCALALLPLLRGVNVRELMLGQWPARRSVLQGVLMAIGFIVVARIGQAALNGMGGAIGTETVRAMQGIHAAYGAAALLFVGAVLVPAVEELVFRGIMLRTLSRYLAVWVAVLLQAGLFMAWHEDVNAYPFLFLFALGSAWLALRSGGLLAPITMHGANNALVALALIRVS